MKKSFFILLVVTALLISYQPIFAYEASFGFCEQGNQPVVVGGLTSTTRVQRSYPSCTISVYLAGTVTFATLYSDRAGTPLANPFTANANGTWKFYTSNGHYDVVLSGGGMTVPLTIPDIVVGTTGLFDCTSYDGASAGAKIAACIDDLPVTGGTADASGFVGTHTISQNMYAGQVKPVRLLLGSVTLNMSVGQVLPDNSEIGGIGPASVMQSTDNLINGIIPGNFNYLHDFSLIGTGVATHNYTQGMGIRMTHDPESGAAFIGRDHNDPTDWTGYGLVVERMLIQDWGFNGIWCAPHSRILNNRFIDNAAEGVQCAGGYTEIIGNYITGTESWGIDVNAPYMTISKNILYNVGDYAALSAWADGNDQGGIVVNTVGTSSGIINSIISENIIDTTDGNGIFVLDQDVYPANGVVITGNTISNAVQSMTVPGAAIKTLQGTPNAMIRSATLTGSVIANNTIKNSTQSGIMLNAGSQASVSSNSIDTATVGIGTEDGWVVMHDISITGNQIRSVSGYGVYVANVSDGLIVEGNRIDNGGVTSRGVFLYTGNNQATVSDNQVNGGSDAFTFTEVSNLLVSNNLARNTVGKGFSFYRSDYVRSVGGMAIGNTGDGWYLEASHLGSYTGCGALNNGGVGILLATGTASSIDTLSWGNSFSGCHSLNSYGGSGTQTYGFRESSLLSGNLQNIVTDSWLAPNSTQATDVATSTRMWNNIDSGGVVRDQLYSFTRCFQGVNPAACGDNPVGFVVIAAASTSTVVNTTAVSTATSNIFISEDATVGASLGVTCNTTAGRTYHITGKSAGVSFTIEASAAPVANPACLGYRVVN